MKDNNLRPNKKLGQNFLIDRNIADKIIRAGDFKNSDVVLEIGAGLGNITPEIAERVKKVIAVEFDKGLYGVAKIILSAYKNVDLLCGDILKFDLKALAGKNKVRVIGNLPYYITTPILERIIEGRERIADLLFMVQKEVAQRMFARPGDEDYGSLSCYIEYYTQPQFRTTVKRTSFFPAPEVDSALVHLKMPDRPTTAVRDEGLLFKIIRGTFNQRRKTILSSLSNKHIFDLEKKEIGETLENAGVSPKARPEELSLNEFARISDAFTR